jgi:hypothetical protein
VIEVERKHEKIKPTPTPAKGPAPIKPGYSGQVPMGDDVRKITTPDGPRKGFSTEKDGVRVFKEEKPWPSIEPVKKPYKLK